MIALTLSRVRPAALAAAGGIAAALMACLAMAAALPAAHCVETGTLGTCLAPSGAAIARIQPGLLLALVGVAFFTAAVVLEGLRHSLVARALSDCARPAALMGQAVRLVPGVNGAVVAGLARPAIYCSPRLVARLERDELKAVLLHERHHQLTWAPLRLVILAAAGRFVESSAAGRRWLVRQRAAIEIAADAYALSAGVQRPVLARAIVKLHHPQAGVAAAGFASAADLRLRALLEEDVLPGHPTGIVPRAGVIAFLVACIALA